MPLAARCAQAQGGSDFSAAAGVTPIKRAPTAWALLPRDWAVLRQDAKLRR